MRVNDRGPYVKKFAIDLSQAAARFLGVDIAEDRHVDIRIIALPGEEPLPEDVIAGPTASPPRRRRRAERRQQKCVTCGIVKQNVLPSPSADSTLIAPPWLSMMPLGEIEPVARTAAARFIELAQPPSSKI